jgi:cell division protein FtsA
MENNTTPDNLPEAAPVNQPFSDNNIVVGLDIGTTKIAVIVGRPDEQNRLEILGVGKADSQGMAHGMVKNIEETVKSISKAVKIAEEKSGYKIKRVNVGIAGQHIKSLQYREQYTRPESDKDKLISQNDVDELIDQMGRVCLPPGEDFVDILPQDYIVEGEEGIKNPIGRMGMRLGANFHIITGQVGPIMHIKRCVEMAGLQIDKLTLEALASSDAVLTAEEREAGVVLVDIGGGTSDIAIFHDDIIRHTAVIPIGGNFITNDVKEGFKIIRTQAEKLKTKFGTAIPMDSQENEIVVLPGLNGRTPTEISVKNLSSIINARLTQILELVYLEIKNSGFEEKLIAGIVITGGGAQMKYLRQLSTAVTGLNTKIGLPSEYLITGAQSDLNHPMFSTCVGLVRKGISEDENENMAELKEKPAENKEVPAIEKIVVHSGTRTKTRFFDKISEIGKNFFNDGVK